MDTAPLWQALRDVEDPEIPVSVVDMGLIVSLAYADGVVSLVITYTRWVARRWT
jgi:metal-sulfur cluster biosynthetic enzyme